MKLAVCAAFLAALSNSPARAADELARLITGLPFPMTAPSLPVIPNRSVSIVDYGAVGDGQTVNTAAFARAIQSCARLGGGRVVVPRGIWLTGPITLVSNIELHLESGALILFTRRFEDYPVSAATGRAVSPIHANGAENIAITGAGIIDGSGDAWRPVKRFKMTANQWKALVQSGGALNKEGDIWYPTRGAVKPEWLDAVRPNLVELVNCKRILLDGPTFQNSPMWNLHPHRSEDIVIRNVTVLNPWYSQNGDGLDIDACRRVVVYNSRLDVGDDAICLKSGAGEEARRRGRATEDVVISNCVVYHGHGGVTVGSEMSGGVRNLYVDNCVFLGTDIGLRFKSTRGRGGVVENLYYNNIAMRGIPTDAIGFTMSYGGAEPTAPAPVDEGTPRFRNIHFKNISCAGAARAVRLAGLPEMPVENVRFDGLVISANTGFEAQYASNVHVVNARILPEKGSVFRLEDSTGVTIEKALAPERAEAFLTLRGAKTASVRLVNTTPAKPRIVCESGATPAALVH